MGDCKNTIENCVYIYNFLNNKLKIRYGGYIRKCNKQINYRRHENVDQPKVTKVLGYMAPLRI